jgi:hypothetical protein
MLSSAQNHLNLHLSTSHSFLTVAELRDSRVVNKGVGSMCRYRISNVDDRLLFFSIQWAG